jgi:hypothetical protein
VSDITGIAVVVGVAPDIIQIEIDAGERYSSLDPRLEIGSYLKISDDDGKTVIVIVQSYRIRDAPPGAPEQEVRAPRFLLDTQPVGRLENGHFKRGGKQITIPPTHVEIASSEVLAEIYGQGDPKMQFSFSSLAQAEDVDVLLEAHRRRWLNGIGKVLRRSLHPAKGHRSKRGAGRAVDPEQLPHRHL